MDPTLPLTPESPAPFWEGLRKNGPALGWEGPWPCSEISEDYLVPVVGASVALLFPSGPFLDLLQRAATGLCG